MKMKPSQLTELLAAAIRARRPILVTGAPGIGKSDIVAAAAKAADAELILSHPAVADPTDAKGLPWIAKDGESATFLPFGELARALASTGPCLWFLDDLGQSAPAVQASFMQLLLARRVNDHVLPEGVTFVAATNRRTDRAGVTGILEPVKSRFAAIVELDANLDEWCQWAFGHGIPAEMIAFLRFRPELLCKFEPTADLSNCPLPRTWANAAAIEALKLSPPVETPALAGAVGEGAAAEYLAFRKVVRELPNIDGILLDPDASELPKTPATLYAVCTGLGMRANPKNFGRVAKYAARLMDATHGEFATLLIRDAVRRDAAIQTTPDFVRVCSGPLGALIGGAA